MRRWRSQYTNGDFGIDMHVTGDFGEMFQVESSEDILEDLVRRANMGEQLYSVARLLALYAVKSDNFGSFIVEIAKRRDELAPETQTILDKIIVEHKRGHIFNSPYTLLNVAKYLLAYGDVASFEQGARDTSDPHVPIFTLLLSSLVGSTLTWTQSHDIKGIFLGSVRSSVFHIATDELTMLQRGYECYINLARQSDRFGKEYIDISALFYQATGVSLEHYLLFVSGIIVLLLPYNKTADELLWTMNWRYNLSTYVRECGIPEDSCQLILDDLSISPQQFKQQNSDSLSREYDVAYFRQKPIVKIGDTFFPIYSEFLSSSVWDRVYWKIHDNLSGTQAGKFRSFFGRLFETYCQELLRSVGSTIKGELIEEFPYGREHKRSPDAFIRYGKHLIVFEFKTKRLNMNKTMIDGNWSTFEKDLEKMFLEPVEQIHTRLSEIKAIENLPIKMSEIELIHPVVVTQGAFSGVSQLYERLDDLIRRRGFYQGIPVVKWHLMDINEFEAVIGLLAAKKNLRDLLMRKAQNAAYRHLPFNHFLFKTITSRPSSPVIHDRGMRIFDELIELITKAGLS